MSLAVLALNARNLTPAQRDRLAMLVTPGQVTLAADAGADVSKAFFESSAARQKLINVGREAGAEIIVNRETAEVAKQIIAADDKAATGSIKQKVTKIAGTAKDKAMEGAHKVEDWVTTHLIPTLVIIGAIAALIIFLMFTKAGQNVVKDVAKAVG